MFLIENTIIQNDQDIDLTVGDLTENHHNIQA